jgi:predicted YcjX-like family ATPase
MYRQDPRSDTYYGFPLDGEWVLTEPTYEQFAERLDKLRAMQREDAANAWRREREYMVANARSDEPIRLVRALLDRAILGPIT